MRSFFLTTLMFASQCMAATLQGTASITPQDYLGLTPTQLTKTAPACGMPYSTLDLSRITAVEKMDTSSTCNLCLNVTNAAKSKNVYVLAVDLGGSGLDMSIPSFEKLFGQRYDAEAASWKTVNDSYCKGIYTPGKKNNGSSSSSSSSPSPSPSSNTSNKKTKKKTGKHHHRPKSTHSSRSWAKRWPALNRGVLLQSLYKSVKISDPVKPHNE